MDRISILQVLKPQGVKGELKCKSLTENLELFSRLKTIICEGKEINVISGVYRLGFVYICLEGVCDRNQAENYRNKTFYIKAEEYGDLPQDSFFIEELIGVKLFNENNEKVGEVVSVENYGATDILIVREKCQSFSVPFIKKIFLNVNIESGIANIDSYQYEENKV